MPATSRDLPQKGLSPRVRGNPEPDRRQPVALSVYPRACGGTSRTHRYECPIAGHVEVYPRACGGTVGPAAAIGQPFGGLSPRVRGNRQDPRAFGP